MKRSHVAKRTQTPVESQIVPDEGSAPGNVLGFCLTACHLFLVQTMVESEMGWVGPHDSM